MAPPSEVTLHRSPSPRGEQRGRRAESHSGGAEVSDQTHPTETAGAAVCSRVKTSPDTTQAKDGCPVRPYQFLSKIKIAFFLPDYQSNYAH